MAFRRATGDREVPMCSEQRIVRRDSNKPDRSGCQRKGGCGVAADGTLVFGAAAASRNSHLPPTFPHRLGDRLTRREEQAVIDQSLRVEQSHSEASGPEGEDRRIGTSLASVKDSSGVFCLCSDRAPGASLQTLQPLRQNNFSRFCLSPQPLSQTKC